MTIPPAVFRALRSEIGSWPADASTDAIGIEAPKAEQLYAPETHAAALDPRTAIVQGARGTGKSFWTGVLADPALRKRAAVAYPRLGLDRVEVQFGFTGQQEPLPLNRELIDFCIPADAGEGPAKAFWWATILRAVEENAKKAVRVEDLLKGAADVSLRNKRLRTVAEDLQAKGRQLVIVFDALDTVATTWPRRTMLTQALLEVVWDLRAYSSIRPKVFVRPDQLADEGLRFVEMPKLRAAAVPLFWGRTDLYAVLFARLALGKAREPFAEILKSLRQPPPTQENVLTRKWPVASDEHLQRDVMTALAGANMAEGPNGHKKGKTYDWPLNHLSDAFGEVTPRSFIALAVGAAKHGAMPDARVFTPDGIRHGLRMASKMRVDQLHLEFPWIKAVLVPLAGLMLPAKERVIYKAWADTGTVEAVRRDAKKQKYLPPFRSDEVSEQDLFRALEEIGVMNRRDDDQRLDMPDLFRVAAKLVKKGGTAPV